MKKTLTARLRNRQLVRAGDIVEFTDSDGNVRSGEIFKYNKKLRFINRDYLPVDYFTARLQSL